jgi:hypothetical protein
MSHAVRGNQEAARLFEQRESLIKIRAALVKPNGPKRATTVKKPIRLKRVTTVEKPMTLNRARVVQEHK